MRSSTRNFVTENSNVVQAPCYRRTRSLPMPWQTWMAPLAPASTTSQSLLSSGGLGGLAQLLGSGTVGPAPASKASPLAPTAAMEAQLPPGAPHASAEDFAGRPCGAERFSADVRQLLETKRKKCKKLEEQVRRSPLVSSPHAVGAPPCPGLCVCWSAPGGESIGDPSCAAPWPSPWAHCAAASCFYF